MYLFVGTFTFAHAPFFLPFSESTHNFPYLIKEAMEFLEWECRLFRVHALVIYLMLKSEKTHISSISFIARKE